MVNKTGVYIVCECCGKSVYKTLSQFRKSSHHFCSNKCQSIVKQHETFEYRACEQCGKKFYASKRSKQRFCSVICQKKWQSGNVGFKNPKFAGARVKCCYCGREFVIGKYKLEQSKNHFCSVECRKNWYARVWSQSDEWREMSRRRAVRILSENKPTTMTKPQIAVNRILDELSVSYRNEEPFVFYSVDNYLHKYHLVIEVMGDYWHSFPIKYPQPVNDVQKRIISRDKAKHTFILKNYGIEILYLWENDINRDPALCAALISKYISTGGVLANYHSFNYYMNDCGVPVLRDKIIYSHQENLIAC